MTFEISPSCSSRLPGLAILQKAHASRFAKGSPLLQFKEGRPQPGFTISRHETGMEIAYAQPCDAYRALALILSGRVIASALSQDRAHETVGVMWDLSRNAVLRIEAIESLFQNFALMGVNSVQLYMEDTYQIPGEPFFGYQRGAYSPEELRRIDDFGHQLGIEVVPCIQTLGHMTQVLQWAPYRSLTDSHGVLLAGEEGTRRLITVMLDHIASCFRTRTIHIGMDEAHGIGTGAYLRKNGYRRPFDILNEHLEMVVGLCRERGLKPMIWSDMYFRIGSQTNDYYDVASQIPADVAAKVPADVDLVYWDYYHTDIAFYQEWIRRHRQMGKEPVFAPGVWNWWSLWAYAPHWRRTIAPGMAAARQEKLGRTLVTVWGDDGAEFHPKSVLPAIQYFAEWAYAGEPVEENLAQQFTLLASGASLGDYLRASDLDQVPAVRDWQQPVNYARWILHHDPVLGFLNAHITADLPGHYRQLAADLTHAGQDEATQFAAAIATAVALKSELHLGCRSAWKERDQEELHRLHSEVLPQCQQAVRQVWASHRQIWHTWNKPFGWDVLDRRYAGTLGRLESLGQLLGTALCQPGVAIPEWDAEPLPVIDPAANCYFNFERTSAVGAF